MFSAPELDKWCVVFPGSDSSVVKRSVYHNYHHNDARPVGLSALDSAESGLTVSPFNWTLVVVVSFSPFEFEIRVDL